MHPYWSGKQSIIWGTILNSINYFDDVDFGVHVSLHDMCASRAFPTEASSDHDTGGVLCCPHEMIRGQIVPIDDPHILGSIVAKLNHGLIGK